ncbi:hypothetical protein SAMD00019534_097150, partial [Acytostelium subglobosum LB1]|uniref:hypothetical protein n=1 Tax=Acytostelium subglobosum LB1 TaxID=1410327 RepID=UPI000644EA98
YISNRIIMELSTTSQAYNAMISAENSVKGNPNTVIVFQPIGFDTSQMLPPGSIITDEEQAARIKDKSMTLMYSTKEASLLDTLFKTIAHNQIDILKQLYTFVGQDEYLALSKMLVTISIGCNNSLRLMRYFIHCDYKGIVSGGGKRIFSLPQLISFFLEKIGQQYIKDILRTFILQIIQDKGLNLQEGVDATTGAQLHAYSKQLASIITSEESIGKLPVPIKVVSMFYHELWPHEEDNLGVSNFLINTFFSTAFTSPEAYDLIPSHIHISARSSNNLVIIGRMLSHAITGASWDYGELKDIEPIKQSIKQIFRESNYFKTVLGSRFSTQSYRSWNHSITQTHTEAIKNYMTQRNEDVSYIGYIMKNGKRGPVKRVLVVGINKIFTFKHTNGKLGREGHLLDLVEINSTTPQQLELIFKQHRVNAQSDDCDHIITCIRRIYEYSFNNWPYPLKMKHKVSPPSRLEAIAPPDHTPTSIMVAAYKSLCAYHQTPVKQTVCWYIENAFVGDAKHKVFNLKLFTKHTREPLTNQDLVPLLHALRYDWYFQELVIKNYKVDLNLLVSEMIALLSSNTTFNSITLSNLTLPKESMMMLFDVIQNQKSLNLTKLDVSKNLFDEKSINSFVAYLQYGQTGAIKTLNISSIGVSQTAIKLIFEALRRGSFGSLESVDFSGNKLLDNCIDVARWLSNEGSSLKELNLADTQLKPKSLVVDYGKSKLEVLNLSRNILKTKEDTAVLSQLFANLTNLQSILLVRTLIPSDSIKELLSFIDKRRLTTFNIGENQLVRLSITNLIACSAIHNIKVLDLTENEITDGGVKELGRALYGNQSITKLVLDGCFRGSPGAQRSKAVLAISNFLQSSKTIEVLKMRGGPKAQQQLQRCILPLLLSLGSVQSLKKLDISWHMMGNQGAVALAKAIYQNRSIRTLLVDNNGIGSMGLANIKNSLKQNYIIKEMPIPIYDIHDIYRNDSSTGVEQKKTRSLLLKIELYLLRNQQ